MTIEIIGYEQNGNCQHCGRVLKHCIRISDGRIVGATCFDKKLTKPRQYNGKPYRVGAETIIRLAKIAQFVNPVNWSRKYGVSTNNFVFEIKE